MNALEEASGEGLQVKGKILLEAVSWSRQTLRQHGT